MNGWFWVFYLSDYIICAILSFAFTNYYVSKKVKKIIRIFSRLFLFANYLLIFTLPYEIIYFNAKQKYLNENSTYYDITNNSKLNDTNQDITELRNVLNLNYKIIFWILITFSNQVIFYVIYFEESGEFTFWRKIWDTIKGNLIRTLLITIIIGALVILLQNFFMAIFVFFNIIIILYAFVFLGLSIVKIPRNMYIHSNSKFALEYYEYKAGKKLKELNKNNEELKKIYFRCKKTFEYIKNIEDFLAKDKKKESNENKTSNENLEDINDNINGLENEKDEDEINIKKKENNENEDEMNQKEEENEKNEKQKEKEIKEIEKDYKKNKSIIKEKKYVELLNINITEIINKYKIETEDELNEKPIKKYKEIVKLNEKSKELDSDNERINAQIKNIYKNWANLKELSAEPDNTEVKSKYDINNNENEITTSLKENEFIPSMNVTLKQIMFHKKYNKRIYISLMIFFIIIGIFITLSEITLILPVNISLFGLIFKHISDPILIHILCIILSSLLFVYVTYSFGKIKNMGRKFAIFGENQTNSLGLLYYCQKLSTISFPLSMNIINMIFHENNKENIKTSLEEQYGNDIGETAFYKVISYIPTFLIIIIIFNCFNIKSRICKKKKTSFFIANEKRENRILEGKEFLMKINRDTNIDIVKKESIV